MEIAQERDGDVVILKLSGRLDSGTARAVEDSFAAAHADPGAGPARIVADLTALSYISSAGLRVLLLSAKRVKHAGGKLALFGLNASVREVFTISGFDQIFAIEPGRSAAIARVK